ncbi:MAG: metal-dependent hydrolase [Oleiphilaceae bacterium]|nr:metal-dependent hydrolase [Oleiphilaceae bacterium]
MNVMPIRRNMKFNLDPSRINLWSGRGKHVTLFLNTLSTFFPEGERYFITSLRNYRDQITDPELQEAVRNFIGQEAMHGREHDEYNDAMAAAGLNTKEQEAQVTWLLKTVQKVFPESTQLGGTIALEHMTALMGDFLLRHKEIFEDADPTYRDIWLWHAYEETEHKGVAYDVWEATQDDSTLAYGNRIMAYAIAMGLFWPLVAAYYLSNLRKEKLLTDVKGWGTMAHFLFNRRSGMFTTLLTEAFDYLRRDFHPWDHDNSDLLRELDALADLYEQRKEKKTA